MGSITKSQKDTFIKELVKSWPSAFVARSETKMFTGGAIAAGTAANRESKFNCKGRVVIGAKLCYPTKYYARWIADNFLRNADDIVDHKPYLHRKDKQKEERNE